MISETKNFRLTVEYDVFPPNPREEWDHLGTIYAEHSRYKVGDESFHNMEYDAPFAIQLPVYMYDHSGITISTDPFSCPWVSGQIGWICVTREKILKEWNRKKLSQKLLEKVKKTLVAEIAEYDSYLSGECYYYSLEKKEDGEWEEIDSCGGFLGREHLMSHLKEQCSYFVTNEQTKKELLSGIGV